MAEADNESDAPLIGARMAAAMRAISSRVLADLHASGFHDLRPAHVTILRDLWPEGRRMSDLADRAGITKPSAAYLVNELELRGYAQRKSQPGDKRVVLVQLSDRGWAAHSVARAAVQEVQNEWVRLVGKDAVDNLLATLARLTSDDSSQGEAHRRLPDRLRGRRHLDW